LPALPGRLTSSFSRLGLGIDRGCGVRTSSGVSSSVLANAVAMER
jgi:hypothetical protein